MRPYSPGGRLTAIAPEAPPQGHNLQVDIDYGVDYQGIKSCLLTTLSHLRVSLRQGAAFATGITPDLYAYHRYTWNSTPLYETQACQYQMQFPG